MIPVDLYGGMPDMNALERLAAAHDIALIEDAAEAIGARYCGRPAGCFGRASVFSFHGSKTLTTGEGGMLVTDDDALLARQLFDRGIRAVVQLALEEPPVQPPREMLVLRFPLVDGSGNDPAVLRLAVDAVARLVEGRIPTLVCCGAGMSRSPAVIAAALAQLEGRGLEESLEHVARFHATDMSSSLWQELRSLQSP